MVAVVVVVVVVAGVAAAAAALAPRQVLQRPRPLSLGSGLPSPVLKLAWQRMQTYIFELDIIGLTPGSACGLAAVYSAWVWRSLGPAALVVVAGVRRVFMASAVPPERQGRREAPIVQ